MIRHTLIVCLMLASAGSVRASTWAEGLFDELSRDFGSVPRGQMLMHPFRLANNSKTPIHITEVRVSCGCTKAWAMSQDLGPGKETVIVAQMDSRRFMGHKQVIIYVKFDQPRYEEVRLMVQANSRDDVIFAPDTLAFGKIKQGAGGNTQMTVTFLGSMQTHITDAKSDSNYIQPKVQEVRRDASEVTYQVTANLRNDIPEGKWYTAT